MKTKLQLNKSNIEDSIVKLLEETVELRDKINSTSSYTFTETELRYNDMKRLKVVEDLLYRIFDIQGHEYDKTTHYVEIR